MALNISKCNHMTPLRFKWLTKRCHCLMYYANMSHIFGSDETAIQCHSGSSVVVPIDAVYYDFLLSLNCNVTNFILSQWGTGANCN